MDNSIDYKRAMYLFRDSILEEMQHPLQFNEEKVKKLFAESIDFFKSLK
jgi:hypothetical protein